MRKEPDSPRHPTFPSPSLSRSSHLVPFLARRPNSPRGPWKPQGSWNPIFASGARGTTFALMGGVEGEISGARAGVGSWYVEGWVLRMPEEWGGHSTYRGPLLSCRANRAMASTLARKPNASCWAHRTALPRGALKTGVRGQEK